MGLKYIKWVGINSMFKKNKKAEILAEQTLKIIIAVMALLLLLYLLFALYSSFSQKKNFKNAEATLENLDKRMVDARLNKEKQYYILKEPDGWRLIGYKSGVKPEECFDNCICLCEDEGGWWIFWDWDDQVEKCNVRGVCNDYVQDLNDIDIELRKEVEIEYKDGKYTIEKK
jgi:hypothetical protein